jgi:hypothetical protein
MPLVTLTVRQAHIARTTTCPFDESIRNASRARTL